ncbi:MAG TPA: two-component regulator propeller domain-containing protein, partial [Candidatus Baltobacteraceae bacterium]|nr:two-component regulator propeller domain-containing protein [Candidatus Baltobacteraceae bacterium]
MDRSTLWKSVLLVFFTIGAAPVAPLSPWANLSDPVFTHIDSSGLPEPSVTGVVQDSQGFMWVINGSGIARFDGYRFKVYWPIENDPTGLPKGGINILLADPRGGLWMGGNSSGLIHYDSRADAFHVWRPNAPHHTGPLSTSIAALALDGNGRLWIGGTSGVERFDPASQRFTPFRLPGASAGVNAASILVDHGGTVWVATSLDGLYRLTPGSRGFTRFPLPMFQAGKAQLNTLFEDRESRLWIGGFQELFMVDRARRNVVRLIAGNDPGSLAPGAENTFAEPRPGEIWVGASRQVIDVIDSSTMHVRRIVADPENPSGLPNGQVLQFLRDRSGLLWIATQQGLLVQNPAGRGISTISTTRADLGLRGRQISALTYAPDGSLIAAYSFAEAGSVTRFDPIAGPQHLDLPDANVQSVYALAAAPDGTIWIGGTDGVCRWKPGNAAVCPAKPKALRDARVNSILFRGGTLYIGMVTGLLVFNPSTGATTTFHQGNGPKSLSNDFVGIAYPDRAGRIWLGTASGLDRLDPKTGRILQFVNNPNDP